MLWMCELHQMCPVNHGGHLCGGVIDVKCCYVLYTYTYTSDAINIVLKLTVVEKYYYSFMIN